MWQNQDQTATGNIVIKLLAFAAYTLLLTSVSLAPASGGSLPLWDKSMHATAYAVYVLLGSQLVRTPRQFYLMSLGIFAYGGLIEIGQHFIPGRDMSALDLLANGLGLALGMLLAILALPVLRRT
jgi:VanZ family protein